MDATAILQVRQTATGFYLITSLSVVRASFSTVSVTFRGRGLRSHARRCAHQGSGMAMSFDTGAPKYAWLNKHLFIAEGRLCSKEQLEYRIYRVT